MPIALSPDDEAWLTAHVESGEFESLDDAIRQLIEERITERMIEEDDLSWPGLISMKHLPPRTAAK